MNTRTPDKVTFRQALAVLLPSGFFFALVVAVAQASLESIQVAAAVWLGHRSPHSTK